LFSVNMQCKILFKN